MRKIYIKEILENTSVGSDVVVRGWVRTKRNSKNVTFINVSDGTTIHTIQAVVEAETISDDLLAKINTGACLEIQGQLIASQGTQKVEVAVKNIIILGEAD
ncbi:MAG TPA: OB-fold nucleic acid binding domain-containing protein, partial [Chitinophagales bacterium]|nr:OB-fold nucleic acid binding domain-containing protein [Chitinophagales bacterium]